MLLLLAGVTECADDHDGSGAVQLSRDIDTFSAARARVQDEDEGLPVVPFAGKGGWKRNEVGRNARICIIALDFPCTGRLSGESILRTHARTLHGPSRPR